MGPTFFGQNNQRQTPASCKSSAVTTQHHEVTIVSTEAVTMPAFAADYFGPKNVGPIYGLMLTPGVLPAYSGPCSSRICAKQAIVSWRASCHRGVMAISTLLPILVRPPRTRDAGHNQDSLSPSPKGWLGSPPHNTIKFHARAPWQCIGGSAWRFVMKT